MNTSDSQVDDTQIPPVEVEVDSPSDSTKPPVTSESLAHWLNQIKDWYESLPIIGKMMVAVLVLFIGFSTLNTILELISSLLSIIVLAVILYVLYKFLLAPRPSQ